jgi:hypothetical protein
MLCCAMLCCAVSLSIGPTGNEYARSHSVGLSALGIDGSTLTVTALTASYSKVSKGIQQLAYEKVVSHAVPCDLSFLLECSRRVFLRDFTWTSVVMFGRVSLMCFHVAPVLAHTVNDTARFSCTRRSWKMC